MSVYTAEPKISNQSRPVRASCQDCIVRDEIIANLKKETEHLFQNTDQLRDNLYQHISSNMENEIKMLKNEGKLQKAPYSSPSIKPSISDSKQQDLTVQVHQLLQHNVTLLERQSSDAKLIARLEDEMLVWKHRCLQRAIADPKEQAMCMNRDHNTPYPTVPANPNNYPVPNGNGHAPNRDDEKEEEKKEENDDRKGDESDPDPDINQIIQYAFFHSLHALILSVSRYID